MIKIEIKRTYKKGEEPRDQIKNNKYNIIMSIDNESCQTIQMDQNIKQVRTHLKNLLTSIPFAKIELRNKQIWESNYLRYITADNEKGFININIE